MGFFNFDLYDNPCELPWVLTARWVSFFFNLDIFEKQFFLKILGAMQVLVNMIITILFANEENLSCFEGLIVQPVFQAFLGFLVMATAVVDTPSKFTCVFYSCLLSSQSTSSSSRAS